MAFGPTDFAADAVFSRQIPVVPLSASSNGNTVPYTIYHSIQLATGEWLQTHTSAYPEGAITSAEVYALFDRTPLHDLYAARNNDDVFLRLTQGAYLEAFSYARLVDDFAELNRNYCVRCGSSAGDGHLEVGYGTTLLSFMKQHRGRETWVVFYRNGFEPYAVGVNYWIDRYLPGFSLDQILGNSPDPRQP